MTAWAAELIVFLVLYAAKPTVLHLCTNCAQMIVYYYTVYSMLARASIALILLSVVAQLLGGNCRGIPGGTAAPLSLAEVLPHPCLDVSRPAAATSLPSSPYAICAAKVHPQFAQLAGRGWTSGLWTVDYTERPVCPASRKAKRRNHILRA